MKITIEIDTHGASEEELQNLLIARAEFEDFGQRMNYQFKRMPISVEIDDEAEEKRRQTLKEWSNEHDKTSEYGGV